MMMQEEGLIGSEQAEKHIQSLPGSPKRVQKQKKRRIRQMLLFVSQERLMAECQRKEAKAHRIEYTLSFLVICFVYMLLREQISGLFGRAPAPLKTAPALASLVERLL